MVYLGPVREPGIEYPLVRAHGLHRFVDPRRQQPCLLEGVEQPEVELGAQVVCRLVAIGAVQVEVGPGPVLQAGGGIVDRSVRQKVRGIGVGDVLVQYAQVAQGDQLVSRLPSRYVAGIVVVVVEVARPWPQRALGGLVVAVQAFVRGGVAPVHRPAAPAIGGHGYGCAIARAHVYQVRVALVRPPFIGEVVELPVAAHYGEAGLHLSRYRGVPVVHGIVEVLDDHRAYGELPYAVLRKLYAFRRGIVGTVVGYGHPAPLVGTVGPEGIYHVVGHEAVGDRQVPQVRKGASSAEGLRDAVHHAWLHEAVQVDVVALGKVEDIAIGVLPEGYGPSGQGAQCLVAAVGDVHREYLPGEPVGRDVLPVGIGELRATVHLAADNRAGVAPQECRQGALVGHAVQHPYVALVEGAGDVPLPYGPTVVLAPGHHVDLLVGALSHLAYVDPARLGVLAHAVGATVAQGIVFLEGTSAGAGEGIGVRYPVELPADLVRVPRIARHGTYRGMAPGRVHVHVDAQHAPVKVVGYVLGAYRPSLFPGGHVEEAVVAELHRTATVGGVVHAAAYHQFPGARNEGHVRGVHLETFQMDIVAVEIL